MAFQACPNCAEVTVVFTANVERVANVFHAEKPGGYDQADINALANLVDQYAASQLLPIMSEDVKYEMVEVRGLDSPNDLIDQDGTNSAFGAVLSAALPNNVTLSLKKTSGFTGRSARGRWYCVGIPTDMLTANENVFDATDVDAWVAAVDRIRFEVEQSTWNAVILSRYANGVLRDEGETFPWASVVAVNENVDSQRRRLTR